MFRLKIDLLFVCETKRNAWFGEKRFDPDNKVTCLFGDFNKTGGVGFLMTNHLKKFIVYSKFIGTRLGRVDFNMGGFIVACIVVYAPTQGSDQKSKDLFYKELEEMCNLEAYDKLIIGGDFNGRIGSNYRKKEARLSFAKVTNCNGDLLSTFAKNQKLKIVNMLFPKSKMKRWTWASALSDKNHKDVNKLAELDYFLCSSSRGILDFRVIPSHLLDIDTDHRMIVMDVSKAFVGKSLSGKIKIGKTMLLNINKFLQFAASLDCSTCLAKLKDIAEEGYITAIKELYDNSTLSFSHLGNEIKISSAAVVKQGDCLSPRIFTLLIQYVLDHLDAKNLGFPIPSNGSIISFDYLAFGTKQFIEIKTHKSVIDSFFYREKGDIYWARCHFAGLNEIVIGLKQYIRKRANQFTVNDIVTLKTNELKATCQIDAAKITKFIAKAFCELKSKFDNLKVIHVDMIIEKQELQFDFVPTYEIIFEYKLDMKFYQAITFHL